MSESKTCFRMKFQAVASRSKNTESARMPVHLANAVVPGLAPLFMCQSAQLDQLASAPLVPFHSPTLRCCGNSSLASPTSYITPSAAFLLTVSGVGSSSLAPPSSYVTPSSPFPLTVPGVSVFAPELQAGCSAVFPLQIPMTPDVVMSLFRDCIKKKWSGMETIKIRTELLRLSAESFNVLWTFEIGPEPDFFFHIDFYKFMSITVINREQNSTSTRRVPALSLRADSSLLPSFDRERALLRRWGVMGSAKRALELGAVRNEVNVMILPDLRVDNAYGEGTLLTSAIYELESILKCHKHVAEHLRVAVSKLRNAARDGQVEAKMKQWYKSQAGRERLDAVLTACTDFVPLPRQGITQDSESKCEF